MKTGKLIRIKSKTLRDIRSNLRNLLLTAVKDKFHGYIDLGEIQHFSNNWFNSEKTNRQVDKLYKLLSNSICICHDCRSTEKDAVFVSSDILEQITYPPFEKNEAKFDSFWLCPECYESFIAKIEEYKQEGYFYFRNYKIIDSLENLGINSLDDLERLENDF